jgi:hypothetical protein
MIGTKMTVSRRCSDPISLRRASFGLKHPSDTPHTCAWGYTGEGRATGFRPPTAKPLRQSALRQLRALPMTSIEYKPNVMIEAQLPIFPITEEQQNAER